jgi:hypothetical protein
MICNLNNLHGSIGNICFLLQLQRQKQTKVEANAAQTTANATARICATVFGLFFLPPVK